MKRWDYDRDPYRPVEKRGYELRRREDGGLEVTSNKPTQLLASEYMDALGRLWHADTPYLAARLPIDPLVFDKIPPEFRHPDVARQASYSEHLSQKEQQENARAEQFNRARRDASQDQEGAE